MILQPQLDLRLHRSLGSTRRRDSSLPRGLWLMMVALMLLAACTKASDAVNVDEPTVSGLVIRFPVQSPAAQRLITATVSSTSEGTITLPGRLAWDEDHTSRVMAPVAGRISETLVQAGALVKPGQPLAYLASAELGSAQAEAARAKADVEQAERNLARTKDLAEAGIVAGKDLEQGQGDLKRTRAEAQRTALRLKSLGGGSTVDQRYALRSPISGAVVDRNINVGMEWRPDQPAAPLFVISDPTYLWCWIDAPESAIGTLRPGQKLRIRASAWPQESTEAQIDYVADALDATSHTLKVRARLRNMLRHLKAEMYVSAEIPKLSSGLLDMPATALFISEGGAQVFVRTGAWQFSRKAVEVGENAAGRVSVVAGLKPGDVVVVDGALYLQQLFEAARAPDAASVANAASAASPTK